jgi:flagellar biosynthetic protein FliP
MNVPRIRALLGASTIVHKGVHFAVFLFLALLLFSAKVEAFAINFGAPGAESATSQIIQAIVLLTVLSLAPSILIMVTSFTRIVVVLSFLRNAIGLQQSPPNMVMVSLAMFLTFFIMAPTFEKVYQDGLSPYIEGRIDESTAWDKSTRPLQEFMAKHVRERDLTLFMDIAKAGPVATPADVPLHILTPAFMISELHRAFEIGFLLFLPFLIIDLVVASVLMSMGMMMVPPVMIALPFKLIFFVLIDGWTMISGSLVRGFAG